ncbi:MAG: hypothetical protein JW715_00355 [Sedimentisphaerales bacterium]|nr:hypothetical protein [Sedimentisphaerales bacterium]
MRDVGGMGESTFEFWCKSVGVTANKSHEDKTGWDYLVEFPIDHDNSLPVDLIPPAIECRVQVKSTDKYPGKIDMSLKNMERLVKTQMPAFICIFEFGGKDIPQRVFLVHIGKELIYRTLKRLRKQKPQSLKKIKRPILTIKYDKNVMLSANNGYSLIQEIKKYIPDGMEKYHKWKEQLNNTVGYESGHGKIIVSMSGLDPLADLIDLSLGLRKDLEVSNIKIYDSRFGIDCITNPNQTDDIARLSLKPVILKGSLRFKKTNTSPYLEFPADVHYPSVNRVVPRERKKFKIDTKFFNLLVEPFNNNNKVQFNILPNITQLLVSLSELNDFLNLLCMLGAVGREALIMDILVENKPFLPNGKILPMSMKTPKNESKIVKKAFEISQKYEIDRKILISLDDVLALRKSINTFHYIITNKHDEITSTFYTDNHLCIKELSGVIFKSYLKLGEYILYCCFGLTGYLELIDNYQFKLVSHDNHFNKGISQTNNMEDANNDMDALADTMKKDLEAKGIKQIIFLDYSKVF